MTIILFSKPAEKDFRKLPREARTAIQEKHIIILKENPRAGKSLHGYLRGYFSYEFWSAGVAYRIAYEIFNKKVIILMIDARGNFYKKFSRRIS